MTPTTEMTASAETSARGSASGSHTRNVTSSPTLEQGRHVVDPGHPRSRLGRRAAADLASQIGWRGVRAQVAAGRGHVDQGEQLARDRTGVRARAGDGLPRAAGPRSLTALAEVLDRARRPDEAGSAADEAARIFERKGNVVSAQRARALGQAFAGA